MVHIILSKMERIIPAPLLSTYIHNATKRTVFASCSQKNHGDYTKIRGNIEQIYAVTKNKIIVCRIAKTYYICSAMQLGGAQIRY